MVNMALWWVFQGCDTPTATRPGSSKLRLQVVHTFVQNWKMVQEAEYGEEGLQLLGT